MAMQGVSSVCLLCSVFILSDTLSVIGQHIHIDCTSMVLFLLDKMPDAPLTAPWVSCRVISRGPPLIGVSLSLTTERLLVAERWQVALQSLAPDVPTLQSSLVVDISTEPRQPTSTG